MSCSLIGTVTDLALVMEGHRAAHRIAGLEEVFGWSKATAGFRKTGHCDLARVNWIFTLTITAYNLVRLPRLIAAVA
jgi:hypothetical protein